MLVLWEKALYKIAASNFIKYQRKSIGVYGKKTRDKLSVVVDCTLNQKNMIWVNFIFFG